MKKVRIYYKNGSGCDDVVMEEEEVEDLLTNLYKGEMFVEVEFADGVMHIRSKEIKRVFVADEDVVGT